MSTSDKREQEIERKRYRRLKRWWNSLSPEQRTLSKEAEQKLINKGLADENGLTPAGELHLLQLETQKCLA